MSIAALIAGAIGLATVIFQWKTKTARTPQQEEQQKAKNEGDETDAAIDRAVDDIVRVRDDKH